MRNQIFGIMRHNSSHSLTQNNPEPLQKPYVQNIIRVTARQRKKISCEEFANLQALCQTKNQEEIQKFMQHKYGCSRCQCSCFTLKPQIQSKISYNQASSASKLEPPNYLQLTASNLTSGPSTTIAPELLDQSNGTCSQSFMPKTEPILSTKPTSRSTRKYNSSINTGTRQVALNAAILPSVDQDSGVQVSSLSFKDQVFQSLEKHRLILIPFLLFMLSILLCVLILRFGLTVLGSEEQEYYANLSASIVYPVSTDNNSNVHILKSLREINSDTNTKHHKLPDKIISDKIKETAIFDDPAKLSSDQSKRIKSNADSGRGEVEAKIISANSILNDPFEPENRKTTVLNHFDASLPYRTQSSLGLEDVADDSRSFSAAQNGRSSSTSSMNRNQGNINRSQSSLTRYMSSVVVALFGSHASDSFAEDSKYETATLTSDDDCQRKCSCETVNCAYSRFY